ncbi:hypothetical protein L083_7968 [Actinoplanes sp. N902-109]|nr:hypothetical protein L083_7968 [Actinoplanes sp. N902-109]
MLTHRCAAGTGVVLSSGVRRWAVTRTRARGERAIARQRGLPGDPWRW